ncbi:MAG: Calcium-transporting ATPase 1 [Pelosinus sp.]|nr:Calcium-transporting ATPase 1 [Pelosinus sp.]
MKFWHQLSIEQITTDLSTDVLKGLGHEETILRQSQYGFNELTEKNKESLLRKFINQFKDFLVLILLAASVISLLIGEITDAFVIIAIVILNASLGVFQEAKAEKALEALKRMSAPSSKTIRDGNLILIPSRELVPGDVVILEAGDYIPADIRIVETANLKVEEASLTGESAAVEKDHATLRNDAPLGDRHNIGFMGTVVTYGRGKGIVVATGMETEIGKIATMIQTLEEDSTPLQKKLKEFGKLLGVLGIAICAVVFLVGIYNGYRAGTLDFQLIQSMLMISISLAVAAIPEGLPTVVTIVLALGMQRMAKKNAIVKKLHAVETLGSTTIICSDKTGTLTQNQMTVVKTVTGAKTFEVTGKGYKPEGEFLLEGAKITIDMEKDLDLLLLGAALCNDAQLKLSLETQTWNIIGDPTEGALLTVAAKAGKVKDDLKAYPRVAEIPFDSARKMMTTFHTMANHEVMAFTKGAPDMLLKNCTQVLSHGTARSMTEEDNRTIQEANQAMSSQALRVLAIAFREFNQVPNDLNPSTVEREMTFIGLLGMIDPARPEAKEAVNVCISAGIRPIMITGDHPGTAFAIAKDLGIATNEDQVIAGQDVNNLSKEQLQESVKYATVFARVSPEHKMSIIDALRINGEVVAMTGDGVNDAPALKKAHIGIAMGITGTDVTKEAADMIVSDDNFATIVTAVEEGRVIFANIRKFIFFLLSCNASEVLVIFLAMILGWPIPLLAIQLLWINLVTDAFPALALGVEKKEPNMMESPPRKPDEPLLSQNMIIMIAIQSIVMAATVLAAFKYGLHTHNDDLSVARTFAFVTLILSQIICAYSARSEYYSTFKLGFFSNKYLNLGAGLSFILLLLSVYGPLHIIFKTIEPGIPELVAMALFAPIPFIATEIYKLFFTPPKSRR